MNPNERSSSSHPSLAQIETLLGFLERNPSLAKGFSKCASARDAQRKHWESLAVSLNSMGGSIKSWKQWNKYWADKKSAVKKKAASRATAWRRTGGGVEQVVELTQVEERIVSLMGGESFAVGDQHLAIHPFDDEPQQTTTHHDETPSLPHSGSLLHYECVPGTSFPSESTSYILQLPAQPSLPSPPRNPPVSLPSPPRNPPVSLPSPPRNPPVSLPSPPRNPPASLSSPPRNPPPAATIRVSPPDLHRSSQQPRHNTTPRRLRRRQLTPLSPPAQRRSQLASVTDRFLQIEEQRLQLDRRHTELLERVVSIASTQLERESARNDALVQALTSNTEAIKMLLQNLKNK